MITMPWWVGALFLAMLILQAHCMAKISECQKKMATAYREILADYFRELDRRAPEHQLGQSASLWLGAESLKIHADEMGRNLRGETL